MKTSPKGNKKYVHVGSSSRCYNVGDRQAVIDINLKTLPNNVKSDIVRLNDTVVKRKMTKCHLTPII